MKQLALQIALVAAGLLALIVFGTYVVGLIREDGAGDMIDTIDRRNQEAGNAADDARTRFDRCPPGVRIDFATGECPGPSADRRH